MSLQILFSRTVESILVAWRCFWRHFLFKLQYFTKSIFFSKKWCYPLKILDFFNDHFDSGTARNGEFWLFPKMSNFGFSVTGPRKMSQVDIFSKKWCYPLKILEFSGDHFDSGTARNGEFWLFSKMSNFGFSKFRPDKFKRQNFPPW